MPQTAIDIFDNLLAAITSDTMPAAIRNKLLHETLVLLCAEGLKDTHYGYGDLNSQTESLIRVLHITADEANAIRQARRDSNRSKALLPEDLHYDVAALAQLTCRVFHCDIPSELTALIPHVNLKAQTPKIKTNSPDKRCIVKAFDKHTITVVVDEDGMEGEKTVRYTEQNQYARMEYLYDILKPGMHLNLLSCQTEGDTITPRIIIVEPDCLMDISVIASCFEDYGHHPLMYLLSRMKERANTQAILLGNYAGACLDDIINDEHFTAAKTLIRNFREKALEYATCDDFDGKQFKEDAARQAQNLIGIVDELRKHYDMSKAILEPTFVCEKLGIQGRVDLMTTDLRLLVEQKSGRNIFLERNYKNAHGAKVVEKHYVQVLLYFGILYYNFHVQHPDIYLLYSKYPLPDGLLGVTSLMQLMYEALRFRNEAIALEFDIAENGMEHILPQLTEQNLNVAHMSGFFYDVYLRPPLENLLAPLHQMKPLEKSYFCRMMQFAIRENILSRVGVVEGTGSCAANLWNMPLAEKIETGNILMNLSNLSPSPSPSGRADAIPLRSSLLTFDIASPFPEGEELGEMSMLKRPESAFFLPNFRRGDMVYVYSYPKGEEPDARKAILYKGNIDEIHNDRVSVRLIENQKNALGKATPLSEGEWHGERSEGAHVWAIEHAGSDVGGGAAIRSLYALISAEQDRKDLLLGVRAPRADKSLTLSQNYNPTIDNIILKAKQAKDFFLLVGPPGTGKTSMALQYMVKESLSTNDLSPSPSPSGRRDAPSLLLMAYTNRAVDEICGMLCDNGIDFLRIGSDLSCAEAYEPYLLQNRIGEKPTLTGMRKLILDARIIVATTSMIQSRSYLFNIKHFSLAIIDEASQILEPNIIGLLAYHSKAPGIASPLPEGEGLGERSVGSVGFGSSISKFILIGDYKQLPAVVQQSDSNSSIDDPLLIQKGITDCKQSLFERLIRQELRAGRTDFIGTLRRQGRMHPDIAEFPNREFYFKEHLAPVPLPHQSATEIGYELPSLDGIDDLLKTHRMIFIESRYCRQPEISDKVNADEARIVADMLRRIHRFYGETFNVDKTVGVIVPYRNQIAMIRKEIEKTGIAELEGISIDTVERYQGSQRDVIIYSFTIQQSYQLDFLTANTFTEDGHTIDRKLNVALTRARKQLIMTGNPRTLSASPLFTDLMEFVRNKGGYIK